MQTMIGVIGGSGVYDIDGLEGASWVKVKTPWGKPSDEVLLGRLNGTAMAFLPRHGQRAAGLLLAHDLRRKRRERRVVTGQAEARFAEP